MQNGAIDEAHLADFKLQKKQSDIEMGPVNTKASSTYSSDMAAQLALSLSKKTGHNRIA